MARYLSLKVLIALLYALSALLFFGADWAPYAAAETRSQMQRRIIGEYIAKYDLNTNCNAECVSIRESENP